MQWMLATMDVVIEDHVRLLNNIIHFSTPNDEGCASTQLATVTVAEEVVLETTIDSSPRDISSHAIFAKE